MQKKHGCNKFLVTKIINHPIQIIQILILLVIKFDFQVLHRITFYILNDNRS